MRRFCRIVVAEGEQVLFIVNPCKTCETGHWLSVATVRTIADFQCVVVRHYDNGSMEGTLEEFATEAEARKALQSEKLNQPVSNQTRH